ncbi:MAG: hypothetical protein ACLUHE_08250 [Christensenellales bacterium]
MVKEVNMDTSSTIKRLLGEYENIRTENQREGQRREREIRQGFPTIAVLLEERRDRSDRLHPHGAARARRGRGEPARRDARAERQDSRRADESRIPGGLFAAHLTAARSAGIPGMSANRYMSFAPA